MNFIYVLHLTPHYSNAAHWDDRTRDTLDRHWAYLVDLHGSGVMQAVGRTDYSPGHQDLFGIAIMTVESEEQAREIMLHDPCIMDGVMTAELHPFHLSLLAGRPLT